MDFTGKHLHYVDRSTGEIIPAEVYVAVLGYSQLTFVEAVPSQKTEDLVQATVDTLEYLGGVPQALVPDNLKAAVTQASRYEPIINPVFLELANYYGTSVYPTRSRKPRDKALVERYVNLIYTRIFAVLRDRTFFSLAELNEAIREELTKHNQVPFQGRSYSRLQRFQQEEQPALTPLPLERFEVRKFRLVKVMKNGHVQLSDDHHYYSVPYRFIGEKVKLIYTARRVAIYCKHEQIALHVRDTRSYQYTTVKEHLSSQHGFVKGWCPEKFLTWAHRIDPDVEVYIRKILNQKWLPEQAYRSCVGILSMEKKVGKERLVSACRKGIQFDTFSYRFIDRILRRKLENATPEESIPPTLPFHDNIRGKEYYC